MKTILVSFLVFLAHYSLAQRKGSIRPFEDYTKCFTGFKNELGDTVWSAQFEEVRVAQFENWVYSDKWIVKWQGKYGLLDGSGAIALPFKYTFLSMTHIKDVFIAEYNGKKGFIRSTGEELIPFDLDEVERFNTFEYTIVRNGKSGIVDSSMHIKIPPVYDQITAHDTYSYDNNYSGNKVLFYFLFNNEKYGLAKSDGKVLFDNSTYPFAITSHPCFSEEYLLELYDDDGHQGLATIDNKLLVPPVYQALYPFAMMDPQGDTLLFVQVSDDKSKAQVINTVNGKKSKFYDHLIAGSHCLLFKRGSTVGILHPTLQEQIIRTPYDLSFSCDTYEFNHDLFEVHNRIPFQPGSRNANVLILLQTEKIKRDRYVQIRNFGLTNLSNNKTIKPKFSNILYKQVNGFGFYFAFESKNEGADSGVLHVFNANLETVATYPYKDLYHSSFHSFFHDANNNQFPFIFKNEKGKFGGIQSNGTLVIPFQYDDLKLEPKKRIQENFEYVLHAKKDNKYGMLDLQGSILVPVENEIFYQTPNAYLIAGNDGDLAVYDPELNKLMDQCQFITTINKNRLRKYDLYGQDSFFNESTIYTVKNDSAYALFASGFKLLNEVNLQFYGTLPHTLIYNKILVDRNGKSLLYKNYITQESNEVYSFSEQDTLYIFHIDKGITIRQQGGFSRGLGDAYVHIVVNKTREGLVSKTSGEWLIPADYCRILSNYNPQHRPIDNEFWVIHYADEQKRQNMWSFININQSTRSDLKFDQPLFRHLSNNLLLCRSGARFGVLDSAYQVVIPFDYINIFESDGILFLKDENELWSAWKSDKGIIQLNCHEVSLTTFSKGRLILDGDKIGILSKDLVITLPLTEENKLPEDLVLTELLGTPKYDGRYNTLKESLVTSPVALARRVNNSLIIDISRVFSTEYQLTEFAEGGKPGVGVPSPQYLDPVETIRREGRTIHFCGNHFYSFTHTRFAQSFSDVIKNGYMDYNWLEKGTKSKYTFVLDGKRLRQAQLADLFLPEVKYDELIDKLLTDYINKHQLFGLTCMNLPQILTEYKKNFMLEESGVRFTLENGSSGILIPYVKLKGVLVSL